MTDESRLANIEKKLDDHGHTLKDIADTLGRIAVQEERIKNVEAQQVMIWKKYDDLSDPNTGQLNKILAWQASCPRAQIRFLWWFTGTVNVSVLIALLVLVIK